MAKNNNMTALTPILLQKLIYTPYTKYVLNKAI